MNLNLWTGTYLAGLTLAGVYRWKYARRRRGQPAQRAQRESPWVIVGMATWGLAQMAALIYCFTNWLEFFNYELPAALSPLGALLFGGAVALLWKAHADLGPNWSAWLEARPEQQLVTTGVYRRIRHPMYAAHWGWSVAQAVLIPNWLGGAAAVFAFGIVYFLRVGREEEIMRQHFGMPYQLYTRRTGRIWPRWGSASRSSSR